MRVHPETRRKLAAKYAGMEFAVFDLQSKVVLGPWTANVAAIYSARDEAARVANDEGRFMIKRRAAA